MCAIQLSSFFSQQPYKVDTTVIYNTDKEMKAQRS